MQDRPAPTTERVWLSYLTCVTLVAIVTPMPTGGWESACMFVLVQLPVWALLGFSYWLAKRFSHDAARWGRAALAVIGLPIVFTALCWLLPDVHPEPYEFVWLEIDRWVFGTDVARFGDGMPPWLVELLQLDYAAFYGLCIVAALLVRFHTGPHAFDRAVLVIAGTFLSSYLGYLLFPTIAPKLVIEHPHELTGLWFTDSIRESIDMMEANHWDCFPSGHTMLTLTSLILTWRWARPWFWILLVPAIALILGTMLLRYHWASDVVVGAIWAWPAARVCDWLADRDRWPAAEADASEA